MSTPLAVSSPTYFIPPELLEEIVCMTLADFIDTLLTEDLQTAAECITEEQAPPIPSTSNPVVALLRTSWTVRVITLRALMQAMGCSNEPYDIRWPTPFSPARLINIARAHARHSLLTPWETASLEHSILLRTYAEVGFALASCDVPWEESAEPARWRSLVILRCAMYLPHTPLYAPAVARASDAIIAIHIWKLFSIVRRDTEQMMLLLTFAGAIRAPGMSSYPEVRDLARSHFPDTFTNVFTLYDAILDELGAGPVPAVAVRTHNLLLITEVYIVLDTIAKAPLLELGEWQAHAAELARRIRALVPAHIVLPPADINSGMNWDRPKSLRYKYFKRLKRLLCYLLQWL